MLSARDLAKGSNEMNQYVVDEIVRKMRKRVPVVLPERYEFRGDPYYHGRFSTYSFAARAMFLRPDIDARSVRHEHGHVFNYKVLRPEHQALLLKWWRMPDRFWWWDADHDPMRPGPEAGCEVFANVYARASISPSPLYYRFKKLIRTAWKEAGCP